MKLRVLVVLAMIAALLAAIPVTASADPGIVINETLVSHSGTDDTEFVELYGAPGTSLYGLSLIVVEGDSFSPGTIDRRFDFKPFHEIGPNGFFLHGNCAGLSSNYGATPDASLYNNYFENSSLTIALVETSSIGGGTVTGSEVAYSAIGLWDGDPGDEFFFDAPVLGPDGFYFPAGARRLTDGEDTGSVDDWEFADFSLPGDNTPTGGGFDGCSPIELTIPEIQGDGQWSIYEGEIATTTGVVTLITANGRDMWIQDPVGDGNPATSDGIFVDDRNYLDPQPQIGDLVVLTGQIEEQQFGTQLPRTRIDDPDDYPFEIVSSGNPLPSPVALVDLPDTFIPDGEAFWEPLEGMLVDVADAKVVAATSRYGEFGMITEYDSETGSGYHPQTKQILIRSIGANEVDYNPERIVVDDASLDDPIVTMPGDKVRYLSGVVDYTFGMYKLQPADFDVKNHKLPKGAVSKRSGPNGDASITTYNVENLFDLIDNPDKDDIGTGGAESPEELGLQLAKLAMSIEEELLLPEIIVVQEIENQEIAQELADLVNAATGTAYVATSYETSDGRGIEAGFLWDDDRVDLLDSFQLIGDDVEAAFGLGSASPGREPIYGQFEVGGETVHIVGNHFKSKGGDDPLYGVNWPAVRVTETQRKLQAQVVRDFVDEILNGDADALVMVTGDLNDFEFGEPGEGADHPVAILEGIAGEVPLTNLVLLEKAAERYSFLFDGNSQVLDHMLVSPALLERLAAADFLHFNAGYPAQLGEDPSTSLRASDHDPLEGRFTFGR